MEPIAVTASQLTWLRAEVRRWEQTGLVDPHTSTALLGLYVEDEPARRRFGLARLLLGIGGSFVGVGLLWLIAANLDIVSPSVRTAIVIGLWLGALTGAEALHNRRASVPLVGAVRLVAAMLFGGVVFQSAQALNVSANQPLLLGAWAAVALAHGYAVRAVLPLVVGVCVGTGWVLWQVLAAEPSALAGVLAIQAVAVTAASVATLHRTWLPAFAASYREAGALLALGALFFAAVPDVTDHGFHWSLPLAALLVGAAIASVIAMLRSRPQWQEPLAALAILGVSALLVLWDAGRSADHVGAVDWAHAAFSITTYVGATLWVAVLAIRHDSKRLTGLAATALVVFTTFQSFAVFARIIQGAWLFLLLGLVLAGTGWAFDRARRELVEAFA